jgi:hypothetical protein
MRLAGMPVLGLLYPSLALVEELDPLTIARECGANGSIPTLAAVLEKATERADALLQDVFTSFSRSAFNPSDAGPADENWYWAAPILIDRQRRSGEVHSWLNNPATPAAWAGRDPKDRRPVGKRRTPSGISTSRRPAMYDDGNAGAVYALTLTRTRSKQ